MSWSIRAAAPDDIRELLELFDEHARYECATFAPDGAFADRLRHAVFGDSPRARIRIACDGAALLGYASATAEFSTWCAQEYLHLDGLYVRKPVRGRGIGGALLDAVIGLAREDGFAELQWQTPVWNADAIRFYRRRGAIGREKLRFALALR